MAHFNSCKKILKSIIIVFLVSSCTTIIDWDKQIDSLITGQSYVIPIGESTITLNDILIQLDKLKFLDANDNYIFIKYNDTITWDFRSIADFSNLETLDDVFMPNTSVVPMTVTNQILTKDFNHAIKFDFNTDVDGQKIDLSEIESAKVEIQISTENLPSVTASNLRITTLFPTDVLVFAPGGDVSKGAGSVFEFNPTVLNAPEVVTLNPFTLYTPNNLSNLQLVVRVDVIAGNSPITIQPDSKISLKYRLYDVVPKVYYGKFKPTIALGAQEKIVDMAEYILQLPPKGIFKIAEPNITIDLLNNSGMKMNFIVDSIKAYKENDPSFTPVYAQFDGSKTVTKVVERIMTYGDKPVKTTFVLDHTLANGDISRFFDRYPLPDRLMYKFKLSNARVASDPLDFLTPQSSVTAQIGVKVPLKLNAGSSFELLDTLENLDMESLINLKIIDQMQLVLKVTNNLPVKGKLSVKFLDNNKLPITGLKVLADSTINAPQIDDNGLVVAGSTAVSDINIFVESAQLPKLLLAKNLVYSLKVENDDNRKMVLQKENFIKLKLGKYSKGE